MRVSVWNVRRVREVLVLGICFALVATAAAGGLKIKVKGLPVRLPGIDSTGNIDFNSSGPGTAKLSFTGRNGKFAVKASGRVPNLSGQKQWFMGVVSLAVVDAADAFGLPIDPQDVIVQKDKYDVKKNGKAKAVLAGVIRL